MSVPEEPVCVQLFRQKPVFTSLHLKSPVHVHRLSLVRFINSEFLSTKFCAFAMLNHKDFQSLYTDKKENNIFLTYKEI